MQIINYLLYYLLVAPLSLLPMFVLYLISDLLFLILWYIIPYRKKIVFQNLRNSFPDKSEAELNQIAKKFYHHFLDLMMETLKGFTASKSWLEKRVKGGNTELLQSYYNQGKSLIAVTSHYGNWEWGALTFSNHSDHTDFGVYAPLNNKFWDDAVQNSRKKFNLILMPVKQVSDFFEKYKHTAGMYGFIADQSPSNVNRCHWMQFLNQDTPVFYGPEKYAREYNYAVVYAHIDKVKRGHYTVNYSLICDDPSMVENNTITELHTRLLEQIIIKRPELWLWTHRRWKKKRSDITN